jgi:hypothetical protein
MIETVKKLLSKDIDEIISTPLSLDLLKVYSILYLCGEKPKTCERSLRQYYNQLKVNGMEKANKNIKRTCKPKWKGNMYIAKEARHFNDVYITDEEAIAVLKRGNISEDMFEVLPEDYKKKASEIETLKIEATDLGVAFKGNVSLKKLKELVKSRKEEINELQESRALEVIELGVNPIPEDLGIMSEEDYKAYKESI